MNHGDSFHNGSENLELQRKNRYGTTDGSAAPPKESGSDSPSTLTRESFSIQSGETFSDQIRETSGQQTEESPSDARPEERSYTEVYAGRVAERTEPYEPGQFGNTASDSTGEPFGYSAEGGTAYYGEDPTSPSYAETANEKGNKEKFNLASLILGIASFAGNLICLSCLTPVTSILAIVFGCMGRVGGKFEAKGLTGFILGIAYWGVMLLLFVFMVLLVIFSEPEFYY